MSSIQQNAIVLFADISGSTALYDRLGNKIALQLVTYTLDVLAQVIGMHHGTLIKTIGDEILCIFPDAISGVNAACAMQTTITELRPGGNSPISIRIGLHYGEVILKHGDVFGDTVNIAARITAITRAGQIMTTDTVVDLLPENMREQTRPVMRTEFRGKEKPFDLFHILWDEQDLTITRVGLSAFRKPAEGRHELLLRYHLQVISLNPQQSSILLGRGEECDILVRNNYVSRQHAHIDLNFGKFLITDYSSNGTFLRFSDHQVIQLNHQQIVLHGAGQISCGQPFSDKPTEVIEYIVQ